jgi:poly(3-hydroxybutyrate) depolymerase
MKCVWLAFFALAIISAGCGDDDQCSGTAFTGGPVTCGMTGTFERKVCVDGEERVVRQYVPATVTCDAPPPLVIFLHGTGSNETSGDIAREIVDELRGVYLSLRGYPQGDNLGFGPEGIPNSRAFLVRVIDEVKKEFPTDSQFTLLTGFSAGAFFSSYCIAWLNDRLAGVGIFGAGLAENFAQELSGAPVKLPVSIRVGDQDSLRKYADSLVVQLTATGWPPERIDSKRFPGGHTWSAEMIREAFQFAKMSSQ